MSYDIPKRQFPDLAPWLIGIVALALGLVVLVDFWPQAPRLWSDLIHDLNAHLEFAINVAMDVTHANARGLLHHLDGARVWGPLHGLVLAVVQGVAGPDHRLGVLPSWCAWIASAVLAFLIARRLLPSGGTAAGVLAASWVLLSPAHRAFGTDVMLESPGAALTLLCLLRYLIAVQDDSPARGRWLGLSLTLLFLTKSNYWLMVVIGLSAGEVLRHASELRYLATRAPQSIDLVGVLRRQATNFWNYAALALVGISVAIVISGGTQIEIAGRRINLSSAHNVVHAAYLIVFVRAVLWWRRENIGMRLATNAPLVRDLVVWHAGPAACYFMLPKRLGYFLWYISPANLDSEASRTFRQGVEFHYAGLQQDYHVFAWSVPVLIACALLGAVRVFRWRKGSATLFCFLALSAFLACRHPSLKVRFEHTWIASLWIVGSAGAIHACYAFLPTRPRVRVLLATGVCLALGVVHGESWFAPGHAIEAGIRRPSRPSALELTETYLPALRDARHSTILCNVDGPFFLTWTYQEAFRNQRFDTAIKGWGAGTPEESVFVDWAVATRSDAVVLLEVGRDSPFFCDLKSNKDVATFRRFLESGKSRFRLIRDWPSLHGVHITLWTATSS